MADAAKKDQVLLEFFDSLLVMEDVSSDEHFSLEGGALLPVLKDVSLSVRKGERWAVYSPSPFSVKLLLEIASNLKPAPSGRCSWLQQNPPAKHQLPRGIFYIDNASTLYENMTTLEMVMFATAKQYRDAAAQQNEIFEALISMGLGHLSLTPVSLLNDQEKALVQMMIATYSNKPLIMVNLPEYTFEDPLLEVFTSLSDLIGRQNKALVFGTSDGLLVEKAASHITCLIEGSLAFRGSVEALRLQHDRTLLAIEDEEVESCKEKLVALFPMLRYEIDGDRLLVSEEEKGSTDPYAIRGMMTRAGILPRQVTINRKTAQKALESLGEGHDPL
ncbi:MAG: hypothetical protein GX819_02350 [Clostridiaceae bacterium]|nr:hypothetical protein [Clostridiaceae bacterium]